MKSFAPNFKKSVSYTDFHYSVYDTVEKTYVCNIGAFPNIEKINENDIYKSPEVIMSFFKKNEADALAFCCNLSQKNERYVVHELIVKIDRKENHTPSNKNVKNNIKKIINTYIAYFNQKNAHNSIDGILSLFLLPEYSKYRYLMLVEVSSTELKTLKTEATTYLNYKNNKRFGINKQRQSLYGFYVDDVSIVVNFKLISSCSIKINLFDLKSSKFIDLQK